MTDSNDVKNALVTGASKGIGRGIALRLAEMGINVAVNYKSSADAAAQVEAEVKEAGVDSLTVQADVSDLGQVKAMVGRVQKEWGHVDILVNNAGIIDDGLLVRMSDDSWERVIDTNLNGTFYCTRAALRTMLRRRWGRIINIGSVVGLRGKPRTDQLHRVQGRASSASPRRWPRRSPHATSPSTR